MPEYYHIPIRNPHATDCYNQSVHYSVRTPEYVTLTIHHDIFHLVGQDCVQDILRGMKYEDITQQSVEHAIMLSVLPDTVGLRNKITTSGTKDDLVDRLIALHENESFLYGEWFYRLNNRTVAFLRTQKKDNGDYIWKPPLNTTETMPTLNDLTYKIMRHLPDYTVEILNIVPKDETNDFPGPSDKHANKTAPNYVDMLDKLGRKNEVIERVLSMDCDQVKPYLQRLTKELGGIDEDAPTKLKRKEL